MRAESSLLPSFTMFGNEQFSIANCFFFVDALVTLIPQFTCAHAHCGDEDIRRRVNDGNENGIDSIHIHRWLTDFSENA